MQKTKDTRVRSLGREDPHLEEQMGTWTGIFACRTPEEEPGGLYIVHGVAKTRTQPRDSAGTHTPSGWHVAALNGQSMNDSGAAVRLWERALRKGAPRSVTKFWELEATAAPTARPRWQMIKATLWSRGLRILKTMIQLMQSQTGPLLSLRSSGKFPFSLS